jgi:hypothetical protein
VPVTTNFVQGGWVSVDHARWADHIGSPSTSPSRPDLRIPLRIVTVPNRGPAVEA